MVAQKKEIIINDINPLASDYNGNYFFSLSPYIDLKISCGAKLILPRSGKYFIEALKDTNLLDKKILDIGTGYFGYLAKHALFFGAKNVVAVDINKKAINFVRKNFYSKNIDFRVSNVYSAIKGNEKFDVIISNPPQLTSNMKGRVHDVAGRDGLSIIKKIISGFKKHSLKGGVIYLLIFDFLFNRTEELCNKAGLNCKIIAFYNKKIRVGGETEKRIKYIEKIYPNYKFIKKDCYSHKIFILKIY